VNKTASPGALPLDADQQSKIDRYGELDRQYRVWKPALDEYEGLKKQIKAWLDSHPADQPAVLQGNVYQIQATARINENRFPNKAKAFIFAQIKKLKQVNPWDLFDISLAAAKEQLGDVAVQKLVEKLRTGSRRLTCVATEPIEPAKAA
jgi:hypothetical protein